MDRKAVARARSEPTGDYTYVLMYAYDVLCMFDDVISFNESYYIVLCYIIWLGVSFSRAREWSSETGLPEPARDG